MEIQVKAYAKINLTLDVLGKRSDGYHNVKTIMQSVGLYDVITLSENNSREITVSCSYPGVPCDERNIAVKCAKKFFDEIDEPITGYNINIEKNIPTQAGLAGGSADGAAVLLGLNELCGKKLSETELEEIGASIGADIPFCIRGGTVLAQGVGTTLTKIQNMPECYIVLVKPPVGISTPQAYSAVDLRTEIPESATDKMLEDFNDIGIIGKNLRNDFEDTLKNEELLDLKKELSECDGALGACMSGSGSAVFAVFRDEENAKNCARLFEKRYESVFVTKPKCAGLRILNRK